MRRLCARALIVAVALSMSAGVATAYAYKDTPRGALSDCAAGHDPLKGHYTIRVLQRALSQLHTSDLQYTTCADSLEAAIRSEELGHRKTKPKPPTTGKGTGKVTQAKTSNIVKARVTQVKREGSLPYILPSGESVTPGTVTVHSASFLSGLPTPLLIVLAALLATVVAVSARSVTQFVRTRRSR